MEKIALKGERGLKHASFLSYELVPHATTSKSQRCLLYKIRDDV